jgi:hypothetical protein
MRNPRIKAVLAMSADLFIIRLGMILVQKYLSFMQNVMKILHVIRQ